MNEFEKKLKSTFGGPVLRVIAEVGPFDAPVRLEDIEVTEGGEVTLSMRSDVGREFRMTLKNIEERSDTEWWVTNSEGRLFYWRPLSPTSAENFATYLEY